MPPIRGENQQAPHTLPHPPAGTGWPSFYEALPDSVALEPDYSIAFMPRVEVRCSAAVCGSCMLLR